MQPLMSANDGSEERHARHMPQRPTASSMTPMDPPRVNASHDNHKRHINSSSSSPSDDGPRGLLRRAWSFLWYTPNPIVQIFYLALVVGGYGAFLVTGLPMLPSPLLGKVHIYGSVLAVTGALLSFISASTTPPGILVPRSMVIYDNYDYDDVLYVPRQPCRTCRTDKLARSKHCAVCDVCVPRFDHHCVWLNSCIGEQNHLAFLRFLVMNVLLCGYGSYVLYYLLYGEYLDLIGESFVDASGNVVEGDQVVILRYLVHQEPVLFVLFVVCYLMGSAVLVFLAFHCHLAIRNLTTNEFFKRRTRARLTKTPMPHRYDLGSVFRNLQEVIYPRYLAKIEQLRRRPSPTKKTA